MKKIIIFVIGFISLFIGVDQVLAFSSSISLNKTTIGPSETVEVTINVSGLDTKGLASAGYNVTYDTSKLEYKSAKYSQSKSSADFTINDTGGTIKILYSDSDVMNGKLSNGGVLTLTFTSKSVATSGSSSFGLSGSGYANIDATKLTSTFSGATLNYKVLSNNANLTALSINSGILSPSFAAATTSYTAIVDSNVSSITINATGATGSTVTGTGNKTLAYGVNTYTVKVTAEDKKTTKTYTLKITRTDSRSSNSSLKSLTPSTGTLKFNAATLNYNVIIGSDISSFTVTGVAADSKASVTYSPSSKVSIDKGETKIVSIIVTAENGTKTTYKVNVKREDNRNSDNTLKTLTVSNTNIKFDGSTSYTATVDNNIKNINISAIVNNSTAKVYGAESKSLDVGKNTFYVKVVAEDETTKTYTINIVRKDEDGSSAELSNNNYLKKLTINGEIININKNTLEYNIDLSNENNEFDIDYELEDSLASLNIVGNHKNSDKIKITVTSESGENRIYTINITNSLENDTANNKNNNIFLYISLAINVILTGIVIALLKVIEIMRRKNNAS